MMLHIPALLAILAMALVTYLTRIGGYLLLAGRHLSPRMQAIMDLVPGCVLVAVIAPDFATGRPADLLGLAVTVLAATRFALLPTMLCGVIATGILRAVLG
ncbi:AzlD family protein [Bombella sp. TMW 2.2543]|uniref:AzlD family protein n=1 Tax=Bombella pluederhausensis TaxID=2967336 RepID=A0ABT3WFS3_9PROT|nr:AzlD family protein [Bombella pluederhausensis]MCX5617070.1 AzlD family protein [Bombella pluederhausensis]